MTTIDKNIEDTNFVFLTPAYNCKKEIKNTLFSFFAQSYDNWRAIIIDDVSTDGTGDYVRELSKQCGFEDRVTVVTRKEKFGEARNTISEIENIDDKDVVCRVDGGDWLTENDCLYILNGLYKMHDPSVVWTAHRWSYTLQNISGPINLKEDATVYDHPWVSSHMKTFRAEKLKRVPKKNFLDEDGKWLMIACDQAIFLPMMHMSSMMGEKMMYLGLTCYHYNIDLEKSDLYTCDRSLKQKDTALWIRKRGFLY
jgi:glycosyltransferase involved in cell wall biosynthesis